MSIKLVKYRGRRTCRIRRVRHETANAPFEIEEGIVCKSMSDLSCGSEVETK